MKRHHIRNSIAAIATVAFLTGGAIAQKEGADPKVQSQPTAEASFKARDPFINLNLQPQNRKGTRPGTTVDNNGPSVGLDNAEPPVEDPGTDVVEVNPPDVTITGIVNSVQGRQAIVKAGDFSQIVVVGQKLADYKVTAITDTGVTFSYANASFEVALASEF